MNIYQMTEQELRAYAYECGLLGACVDTLIRRVIYGEKWAVIADKTKYSYNGIMRHRMLIIAKFGVDKL